MCCARCLAYRFWTSYTAQLIKRPHSELEVPMLTIVSAWMFASLLHPYSGQGIILGALCLGWFHTQENERERGLAYATAAVLETGLWVSGANDLWTMFANLFAITAVIVVMSKYQALRGFQNDVAQRRQTKAKDNEDKSWARDFGLLTEQAPVLEDLPRVGDHFPTVGRATLDFLTESFDLQLRLLRQSLNLSTAIILWRSDEGLAIRGVASLRDDVLPGPFPEGAGLPGSAIRNQHAISLAPVHENFSGLPYYQRPGAVGSAYAVPIKDFSEGRSSQIHGVLCVDRLKKDCWSAEDKTALEMLARKVSLDVATGQRLKATDYERATVTHLCAALQELNTSLGLGEVAEAVAKSVQVLVNADLTVLATVKDDCANIIYASGDRAADYLEKSFQIRKTLVGRAVELGRSLPANGQYSAKSPIFFEGDCPQDLGSLLVLPLTTSDEGPMGVLVLGARASNVFGQQIQTMLELIAGQVAIKLDLGKAHETIREMAMVDGMTGLKNHRTFQQAFDTMLERASRRQDDLCMMLMDIDHFKRLNDTYGHPFGDEVLKQVAAVLGSAARKVDLAARYGGEEFALLIEDADLPSSRMIAERVRAEVEALRFQHDSMGEVSVTISMGIACYPEHGQTKDELVANADQALYLAKQSGRNRVCDWSELPNGFDEDLAEQTSITASG